VIPAEASFLLQISNDLNETKSSHRDRNVSLDWAGMSAQRCEQMCSHLSASRPPKRQDLLCSRGGLVVPIGQVARWIQPPQFCGDLFVAKVISAHV
jgi:hypothetical protein